MPQSYHINTVVYFKNARIYDLNRPLLIKFTWYLNNSRIPSSKWVKLWNSGIEKKIIEMQSLQSNYQENCLLQQIRTLDLLTQNSILLTQRFPV